MSRPLFRRSTFLATGLALAGCNPSSCLPSLELPDAGLPSLHGTEDPILEDVVVQGRVSLAGDSGASSRSGVAVRLSADLDGNGALSAAEQVETTTDSDGKYRLQLAIPRGKTAVVRFHDDDAVTVHRSLRAGPKANVRMNVTLVPSQPLDCTGPRCALEGQRLTVAGLAGGVSGRARVFNPVTEADQFPGNFDDTAGNLLISGVFSTVELTDGNGQPVSALGTPAQLRMALPPETWRVVKDLHAGNGRIDVPMYAFDDVAGTWRAEGEGVLEDGSGRVLTEAELAGIRAGTFNGVVVAAATVTHFSSWNVDWPVDTKACLTGVVLDRDGNPAEGATVFAAGVTYNGQSTGVTAGTDGKFCVDVMRSDGAGDDVDQDGITGETQAVRLRVAHRGLLYDLGQFNTPASQGRCADGNCLDVGTLRISRDNELIPTACTYTGTVKDKEGTGLEGVSVMGFDPALDGEMMMAACFGSTSTAPCEFLSTTDSTGAYSVRTAIVDGVSLFATRNQDLGNGRSRLTVGGASVRACPGTPVDIVVEVVDTLTLSVTASGSTIAWTPAERAQGLFVTRGGSIIWQVSATGDAGFLPPVTYGTVPAGAAGGSADGGVAPPLASGDSVTVMAGGVTSEGYPVNGTGSTTVP